MPVFHTKIIESILEPVAQQVSRLVILHEEAEDGNAMPDLNKPVQAVSYAVNNLVKVGHETISSSDDQILRQEMPTALRRVEEAAGLLQDASAMLRDDPYSGPARKKLIEGSRGILQGTSGLLLCFDESEVRKIVKECKKVLDYLAVAEVIDSMEDLVQFLRDLSPSLSRVAREVSGRAAELTHRAHADILTRCLEQVKSLAPILICSMKIYIHILSEGGKGMDEAQENRNYLSTRMANEIHEIIRVLQLTTYDEESSEQDSLTVLRGLQNQLGTKLNMASEWLNDPDSPRGSSGERALRAAMTAAERCAERFSPPHAEHVRILTRNLRKSVDQLADLRDAGHGSSPQAMELASQIRNKVADLMSAVNEGIKDVEMQGAKTLQGRLETAHKWLLNPSADSVTRAEGQKAINTIVAQGQKISNGLQGREKAEILQLCGEVQRLSNKLADLCNKGHGESAEAKEITRSLSDKLCELKNAIERAVVNRVVEDFIDIATPLKQFSEAVNIPEGVPGRDQRFSEKANNLAHFSDRANQTAQIVAVGGSAANKRLAEDLVINASQVEKLSPQLISAGRIRLTYPSSKVAEEHFNNLRQQYADTVLKVRDLCDQAVNPLDFIKTAGELMQKHTYLCEEAIRNADPQKMVDNTSAIARLSNRVLLVAAQEMENSEDVGFRDEVAAAHRRLQAAVAPAVTRAKAVAINPHDHAAANAWRDANNELLQCVAGVEHVFQTRAGGRTSTLPRPPLPDEMVTPPPRPPPPVGTTYAAPPRPPPPADTDDEDESIFRRQPHPSQPIMVAAHNLHRAVRQWSSKDNEIIAAAKKMAVLMARLSELVRSDSKGSKRELIATAKAIAEASEEVTRLAKKLALECTDKRIRTNLLQVCERIPTIGTQLKILSTVKATMLGAQVGMPEYRGSEEDQEATEMLVGNAQNLMQSVKETVKAAEGASIKIRTDQGGYQLRWVRRSPWYQM